VKCVERVANRGLAQREHDEVHGLVAGGPSQGDVEAQVGLVERLDVEAGFALGPRPRRPSASAS
jgi:hypothetical protein